MFNVDLADSLVLNGLVSKCGHNFSLGWGNEHNSLNIGLNGIEVSPRGLIFDKDGATGCPMPPEALPTPLGVVLNKL